jgi:gentisate 1,2-dioxygenase
LMGYWMRPQERKRPEPRMTKWSTIYPLLLEAGEAVSLENAFRRNISGFQIVMPGEKAPAHRHTASAMRLVIVGDGSAYTTTNGEQMFMEPGDFLVQPGWGWHDHSNPGTDPVIWMDMLDNNLVSLLEVEFREDWPGDVQQPVIHPEGFFSKVYGQLRPARLVNNPGEIPPMTYKYRDTVAMLRQMADEEDVDPHDGVILEYTNPVTGGHVVPTLSAKVQMLRPGESTRPHRHTGTVRHHVIQGRGVSAVDLDNPTELIWEDHDTFWIPSWRWHQHRNTSTSEPAIIFTLSDSPQAEAFGFYREEKG